MEISKDFKPYDNSICSNSKVFYGKNLVLPIKKAGTNHLNTRNLSLSVIANYQWVVSKPYIQIFSPCRLVEGHGKVAVFCGCTFFYQYIDWIKGNSSIYSIVDLWR